MVRLEISTAESLEEFDPVGRGKAVNLIKKTPLNFFEATTLSGIWVPQILEFSKKNPL